MKKEPYIEMVSNQIVVLIHESDYKEKYPHGVCVTHSHSQTSGQTSVISTYMGQTLPENEQFYFDKLFFELMGGDEETENAI